MFQFTKLEIWFMKIAVELTLVITTGVHLKNIIFEKNRYETQELTWMLIMFQWNGIWRTFKKFFSDVILNFGSLSFFITKSEIVFLSKIKRDWLNCFFVNIWFIMDDNPNDRNNGLENNGNVLSFEYLRAKVK